MTRVVHVVVAGEVGGAERMLRDLVTHAGATGAEHAVALVTPSDALRSLLAGTTARVHDRGPAREGPLTYLRTSLGRREVAWIEGVLREEKADVAQLHTFASQVVGTRAAIRARVRVVRTEHSTRVYDDPSCWPFSRWSLARADAVVCVSEHVRDVAEAKAGARALAGRIRVVHNGVDVARFAVAAPPPADAPFTFVLVGRLEPRKGIDLALEALARVPDARLEVVGDGAERASLEDAARRLGVASRARFHGALDDPRPVIAHAHAALCSSRSEGLGIANLEAMASGRPVVSFAVGGVPEVVTDGATGLLARAGDVADLAAKMRELAADRARAASLGATARAAVVARFSLEAMCEGWRRVYADVTASTASRARRRP